MKTKMEEKIDLEVLLLSTIFSSTDAFNDAIGLISTEEIFDKPEHRIIFSDAVKYFTEKGKAPQISDIYEMQLTSKGDRERIKNYLSKVLSLTETEIRETSTLAKKVIEMKVEMELRDFQNKSQETGLDYIQAVNDKALELYSKYLSGCRKGRSNLDIAETLVNKIMKGAGNNFIKTGFEKIDKYTNGIPKNHITVIAARPGVGKTDFMLQLLRNLLKQDIKVGIFSLEMTSESLLIRNISALTGIDTLMIEAITDLTQEEKRRITEAAKQFSGDEYVVIDNSIQTPGTIKAQINLWKLRNQVDIILLDYMTLVNTDYKQSRQDLEIGKLSAELNSIAKNTGLPIVILSQLNRQSEARVDKRPQLSDLRESGSIEQDANLVLLLYRPGLYGIDATKDSAYNYSTQEGSTLSKEEYFEVIIAKARNGRTGNVPMRYRPEIHTFESVALERLTCERIPREYEAGLSNISKLFEKV